jgi:drug/metabolite transporter (DMT)-like permease
MKPTHAFQLLLVAALWGFSFIFMRVTSPVLGPVMTAFLRVVIGGGTLLAFALMTRQNLGWRRFGGWIALVGLLNSGLPFVLISFAELTLTASMSAILNATASFWTVLIASLWFGDVFTLRRFVGLALGILGVTLLVGWSPLEPGLNTVLSVLALLMAAFSYGLAANLTKAKLQGAPPIGMVTGALLTSSLSLAPLAPWNPIRSAPDTIVIACLLALALACTVLAYLIFLPLVVHLGASRTSVVGLLVPVFGVAWSAVLLGEAITLEKVLSCAVILIGAALVTGVQILPRSIAFQSRTLWVRSFER